MSGSQVLIVVGLLMALFQLKHLVADFYLQTPWMWQNKGQATGWVLPLLAHCSVNAAGSLIVLLIVTGYVLAAGLNPAKAMQYGLLAVLAEFVIHFICDRWKANSNRVHGYGPTTHAEFWYHLGVDQLVHHLAMIIISLEFCLGLVEIHG